MGIRYDMSAVEILNRLGFDKKSLGKFIPKDISVPKVYQEFMERALDCPLLGTSDIWVNRIGDLKLKPYFLYKEIEEAIADQKEDWEKDEEFRAGSAYYPFSRLPKERWSELVGDFFKIGSDYGAGVVDFAIRKEDLEKDDPPVWRNHEADEITDWKKMYETVSDFLLEMLLNALACIEYTTAKEELEEKGWVYQEGYEEELTTEHGLAMVLQEYGIDFMQMRQFNSVTMGKLSCCYEEEKNQFYLVDIEEDEVMLFRIFQEEQETE
jgi:hypothetical protein